MPRALPKTAQGAALIVVLWLVLLLTLLATAASSISVSHRRSAALYAQSIAAEETMDSATRLVLLAVIASPFRQQVSVLSSQSITLFDTSVLVTVEREEGRIDLNSASQDLLLALFATNGWSDIDARSMAARIIDWRDSDDVPEPFGAELPEYRTAHRNYGPRNARFESVDELRQVLGGEKIGPTLMNSFTVYSHAEVPNESAASPIVLRALRRADRLQLGGHRWLESIEDATSTKEMQVSNTIHLQDGELLRLSACIAPAITASCRVAVVRLTGNERKPFLVFVWKSESSETE